MLFPMLADIPSNAVLFGLYELTLRAICPNSYELRPHLLECYFYIITVGLIAGGVAGIG